MKERLIERADKARHGGRLRAYTAIERQGRGPMSPFFENVFRRARSRRTQVKLGQYLAIERRS